MDTAIFYNRILDIVTKYSFDVSNEWIRDMFLPQKKNTSFSSTGDLLNDLFTDFDFRNFQIPGFWFISEHGVDTRYITIGACDTDRICIDRKTQEVLRFTEDDEFRYYLAGNLSDYMSVLLLLIGYHISGFMGHTYTDSENDELLRALKTVLVSEKYYPYYEDTYGAVQGV